MTRPSVQTWYQEFISRVWGSPRASWQRDFLWEVFPVLLHPRSHLKWVWWVLPLHTALHSHFLPRMEVGASGLLDQIHASLSLLHNSLKHTVGPVHLLSGISGSKETFNILFEGLNELYAFVFLSPILSNSSVSLSLLILSQTQLVATTYRMKVLFSIISSLNYKLNK